MDEVKLFYTALNQLARENELWRKNYSIFAAWPDETREWWIKRIKQQAQKDVPIAVTLMAKVVEIRLGGINGNPT
jgi:urease accessory protein UreF